MVHQASPWRRLPHVRCSTRSLRPCEPDAARAHRDTQRRKSAWKPPLAGKLVDCRRKRPKDEVFIVEGDSALGTAKSARDADSSGPAAHSRQDPECSEGFACGHVEER